MSILEVLTGPWAITPDLLLEMQAIYEARSRGEALSAEAFEAMLAKRPDTSQPKRYEVIDGVAVLPINGVLAQKANMFTAICGGMSMQMAQAEINRALADRKVESIVLSIDSPGGTVLGTPELGATIREASAGKPLVAYSDSQMASAAYWAGSSANQVYISGPTVQMGSIGVVATHVNQGTGNRVSEITAGKYKRINSSTGALSAEGRQYMQDQVDYLYGLFVDAVAANRGVDAQAVLKHMADGKVFIGQQAIDAGLADGMTSLDQLVADMASNPGRFAKRAVARPLAVAVPPGAPKSAKPSASLEALFLSSDLTDPKGPAMSEPAPAAPVITRETLERDHAALFASLQASFTAQGAEAERDRIQGVRAQLMPGHEALIEGLAFDGKTTPGEAAMAVNAAERALLAAAAQAHANDAPPALKPSPNGNTAQSTKTRADMAAEATKLAADKGIDFVAAMKELGYA